MHPIRTPAISHPQFLNTPPIEELRQELRPIVEHILALSNPLLSLMEHHFIVQTVVEGIGRRDEHSEATV